MRRFVFSVIAIAVALALLPSDAPIQAQGSDPITWSLDTPRLSKPLQPGGSFEARLTATIQKGWHLYALTQPVGGPMPTRVTLPDGQPFALAGPIKSPPPYTEQDPNFGIETEFFAESVTFTLPIKVAAEAKAGPHVLQVTVRFQACNDRLRLPPAVVKRSAVVTVTAGASKDQKSEGGRSTSGRVD